MYKSIELPYSYDALEPFLSARTVNIHFYKHYQNYLKKLNELLTKADYNYAYSKEELVEHIDEFPLEIRDDILFNLGGVLNHELYFLELNKDSYVPTGLLEEKINETYGSFENFKKTFIEQAKKTVGSSYTFLVIKRNMDLDIINTSNQETPYLYGFVPILALDLWEHAYYLDYQNNKNNYIENFFQNVDFRYVASLYEEATKKVK